MVTGPASSAENGDPRRPAPSPPPPQLLSHRQPPTHWALSRLPFAQPPFRRACARRWINQVDPTVYRGDWTEEEESRLRYLVETLRAPVKIKDKTASSWSDIAKLLATVRSPQMCRTAAWSKCPRSALSQSSELRVGVPSPRSSSPCGHPPLLRRSTEACPLAQGHPEYAPSRP